MKEIIEYILAGIIIVSFIPLYTVINTSLYNPPPRRIDPNVMVLYSSTIEDVLNKLISTNNFTPALVDIVDLVRQRVGEDVYREYGFHVRIVSWGIVNITLHSDFISVYTRDLGNVTVLIIKNDLTSNTYLITQPTIIYNRQGIYRYDLYISTSDVIIVVAVLETGITRYIDYYIDDDIYKTYILNINGKVYVLNDLSNGAMAKESYGGYQVVDAYLYYYTKLNFSVYRHLHFVHSIDTTIYIYRCSSSYCPGFRKNITPVIYTDTDYYIIYDGTVTLNGKTYEKLYLSSLVYEENYTEIWQKKDRYGGWCWYSEVCDYCTEEYYLYDRIFRGDAIRLHEIESPLYNAVLILLKDDAGRLYVATFYHYEVEFGDTVPRDWQTDSLIYIMRIGMVDYEVILTIWRRTV